MVSMEMGAYLEQIGTFFVWVGTLEGGVGVGGGVPAPKVDACAFHKKIPPSRLEAHFRSHPCKQTSHEPTIPTGRSVL